MKKTNHPNVLSNSYSRRDFLSTGLKAGAAALTTGLLPNLNTSAQEGYNVLLLLVDDLRPFIGSYGHPEIHTPNIDIIAQRGTLFNRAYCQYPLCNPSRTSILTGLRPNTTRVTNNTSDYRENIPDIVTLPQHFKEYGYHTQSVGRVHHLPRLQDDENSWSVPSWRPVWRPFDINTTPSWQALDVNDNEPRDGQTAVRAVQVLDQIHQQKFFLTVGFYKPHFPLDAPRKYFDLYNPQDFELPASSTPPHGVPNAALTNWTAIRGFQDIPDGNEPLSNTKTIELIHAYAACTSYIDAQIGRVLAKLDNLGLTQNTVIVFCGDHGHHLGEHGILGKQTLFEVSLRSPLIVSVPGQQPNYTNALVELVDIFPTLSDVCQLPIPAQLEGISMKPVIEQPTLNWKTGVFSQFGNQNNASISMRTDQYRYTERGQNGKNGKELYDYYTDPNETVNIANHPENSELAMQLSERLHAGWEAALPTNLPEDITPKTLRWDINDDGIVNMDDLSIVSASFWVDTLEYPKADVNNDGIVNIIDLLQVAAHLGESTNPSAPKVIPIATPNQAETITEWISVAQKHNDGSEVFKQGILSLEKLIYNSKPQKTTLLPNFPNPFNPETWMPYDLAQDVNVSIEIYNPLGSIIRTLDIGFQTAGMYRTRQQAAYWDGCNSSGERVASGLYFYVLKAGQVRSVKEMVIRK